MGKSAVMGAVLVLVGGLLLSPSTAQEEHGTAEQIGERIDRGLERLGQTVRKTWTEMRRSVDELSVQGRVYGRIRWDKTLATQSIGIDVQEKDVVVLTGAVSNDESRRKAVLLARETIGVREVVDRLEVDSSRQEPSAPPSN